MLQRLSSINRTQTLSFITYVHDIFCMFPVKMLFWPEVRLISNSFPLNYNVFFSIAVPVMNNYYSSLGL